MIVAFCGHADTNADCIDVAKLNSIFDSFPIDKEIVFYLGGYGKFDAFVYKYCKAYQQINSNARLIFVTPYLNEKYLKHHEIEKYYDGSVYLDIEKVPKRFAILQRNRKIVDCADLIICYITHNYGGAYQMYKYAEKCKKDVINLVTK